MNTNNTFNFADLSVNQKRDLVKQLRESIKTDLVLSKANKASLKKAKEIAKKDRIQKSILAAQEKLAKLQAKLAA